MATIKEIARLAGVSPTTVSNVLNGNTAKVSPATREKVEIILRKQNYAPNMGAHILGQNRSRIVGVIMFMEARRNETVLEDPFSSTLLGAIEAELRRHGFYMMVHTTCDEEEVLRLSWAWKPAGLILAWVPQEIMTTLVNSTPTPVVFIDSYYSGDPEACCSVGLEDRQGALEMGRYLISMGHRNILFLSNSFIEFGSDHARLKGLRQAMKESNLSPDNIRHCPLPKDQEGRYSIYRQEAAASSLLAFSSDYMAAEAVAYFQETGIEVPEDISVSGFDDNIFSHLVRPRLTTVHQDTGQKGKAAVELLHKMVSGEAIAKRHLQLPTRLVLRDSVSKGKL